MADYLIWAVIIGLIVSAAIIGLIVLAVLLATKDASIMRTSLLESMLVRSNLGADICISFLLRKLYTVTCAYAAWVSCRTFWRKQ